MGLKKLRVSCTKKGARGTEKATEMIDLMKENWGPIQENFNLRSEDERLELIDHFNNKVEDLGEMLLGENANKDDFENFAKGLDESEQGAFMEAVNEALILEDNPSF